MNHSPLLRGLTRLGLPALLAAALAPAEAATLRAYAGAVAGNASGTGTFACATSGPTIPNPWFSGISLPTEGFAACNLAGGITDLTAASGELNATQSATGPGAGRQGLSTLSAQARADYWSVGAAASGSATGGGSTFTYQQAVGFASFTDTLTFTSAGIANGTAGSVNFEFLIEGLMSGVPVAPYGQQMSAGLGIRINNEMSVWRAFNAQVTGSGTPFIAGGATGLPGTFVLGPGSLSGESLVNTTANFGFVWGTPFTIEVAMIADVTPCCFGASQSVDLLNTAVLRGIDAYGPGRVAVTDFQVSTESGALIGANGLRVVTPPPPPSDVPTPGVLLLLLAGLAAQAALARAGRAHAGPGAHEAGDGDRSIVATAA